MSLDLQKKRDQRLMAREDRLFGIVLICAVLGIEIFILHKIVVRMALLSHGLVYGLLMFAGVFSVWLMLHIVCFIDKRMVRRGL
jgi:hypothetical protein